jgi:ABC-type polysaccharide/polyol phosphate transport system ATPase subunit
VTDAAISLEGVSKRYVKYDDAPMLTSALRLRSRTKRSVLSAVTDLDLRVDEGETVGVLGRNGAGKSTLLQMLCGITAPSTGRVRVRGRVAPLISVGVGFHPELTGRENVYVNGTVLGMSRRELDRRFDEVVAFAELEEFIDTPVKFYSSGMFVRLGFSVAVAADPDVLLVDEVLAVGDFAFQIKCYKRMEEIRAQGTTIVMVSHNVEAIRGLCARGIVMQRGRKLFDGPVHEAVSAYYGAVGQTPGDESALAVGAVPAQPAMVIESFELLDPQGRSTAHVETGDDAVFRLRVQALAPVAQPCLGLAVASESSGPVYSDTNLMNPFAALAAGERATYDVRLKLHLAKGGFTAKSSVHSVQPDHSTQVLARAQAVSFYVGGKPFVHGVVDLDGSFNQHLPG